MNWTVNKAIIIGHEHIFARTNRQDFCGYIQKNEGKISGVICDGCSSGSHSEVGASLIGMYLLKLLDQVPVPVSDDLTVYRISVQVQIETFIYNLMKLMFDSVTDRVYFVNNYLLSTFTFCVITDDKLIIGHAGDGIIAISQNGQLNIENVNHDNKPHYISYNLVPEEVLDSTKVKSNLEIKCYPISEIDSIIIASDGLEPLVEKNMMSELYGNTGRKLQRKFNIWQNNRMFGDDVSCLVIEKSMEDNQ